MSRLLLFTLLVISIVASNNSKIDQEELVSNFTLDTFDENMHEVILSFLDFEDHITYSSLNKKIYKKIRNIFFLLCSYRLLYGFSTKFQFIGKNRKLASQILLQNILSQYTKFFYTPKFPTKWIIFQYRPSIERPLEKTDLIQPVEDTKFRLESYIYNSEIHEIYRTHQHFNERPIATPKWIYTASFAMPLFVEYTLWNGHRYDFLGRYTNFYIQTENDKKNPRITTVTCRDNSNNNLNKRLHYRQFQFDFDETLNVMIKVKLVFTAGEQVWYESSYVIRDHVLIPEEGNTEGFDIYSVITGNNVFRAESSNKRKHDKAEFDKK